MSKIIAIDFDGTIVTHRYPQIGDPVPHAIEVMKMMQDRGDKLILYTMRSGLHLLEAVDYCRENGIEFWGINENPEQHTWTNSRKVYAQVYIDDAAFGCPTITDCDSGRPCVDWFTIKKHIKVNRL